MLDTLKEIIDNSNCEVRFNWFYDPGFELTEWVDYFSIPADNYIEIPFTGPIEISSLKWIEINPIEKKIIGRLVPPKKINHTKELIDSFNSHKIGFTFNGELIKIENGKFGNKPISLIFNQ